MSDTTASVSWTSLSDDVALSASDQIRIEIDVDCSYLDPLTAAEITSSLAGQSAIGSVLSVDKACSDFSLTLMCSTIYAVVNPQQGVTAGDIRNAAYTAISSLSSSKLISCTSTVIGPISRSSTQWIPNPTPTQTISLVALAILGIVAVFLVMQVKEAV